MTINWPTLLQGFLNFLIYGFEGVLALCILLQGFVAYDVAKEKIDKKIKENIAQGKRGGPGLKSFIAGLAVIVLLYEFLLHFAIPAPQTVLPNSILAPSPTPPYSCSDKFPNNSLHWPFDAVWHKNGNYLNSTPTDTGFHQIIVPCFPDTTDYVFEVQAKIENYNPAKEEFGMVIHWDESTGGGYQAGIASPGIFVRLAGLNNPPYYPFPNPGDDLITYKLQVKNKIVTFFVTDGNTTMAYPSPRGVSANNFPSPGQVVLWIRGGTHVDIISTSVDAV